MVSSRCITSSSCSTASSNSVKTKCHGSSYYRPQPFGLSRTQWESPTTWFHKSLTLVIKGPPDPLPSKRENPTREGRRALKKLLAANKRLQTAYLLKESFDRLWTYKSEAWMRKFFDNWKDSLKWQRLGPFVKFAAMVERNWDGLARYSRLVEKPALGFVEGLNTKIRVIQRRAYGLRDEEYLRLKILTSMLPGP